MLGTAGRQGGNPAQSASPDNRADAVIGLGKNRCGDDVSDRPQEGLQYQPLRSVTLRGSRGGRRDCTRVCDGGRGFGRREGRLNCRI